MLKTSGHCPSRPKYFYSIPPKTGQVGKLQLIRQSGSIQSKVWYGKPGIRSLAGKKITRVLLDVRGVT